MRVAVVASQGAAGLHWSDDSHPVHLPGDLVAALTAAGFDAHLEVLPADGPGRDGRGAYSAAASNGRWLAERHEASETTVLHAIDPVATMSCLAARRVTGLPVVARWGPLPKPPGEQERRLRLAGLRAADVVVGPTDELARRARAAGAAHAVVVPDGVDCEALAPDSGREVVDGPLPRIAALSGPVAGGGVLDLLKAVAALPDVELVIAGRAPQAAGRRLSAEDALLATVDRMGLVGRVRWLGWLPRADALDLISDAAVVAATRRGPSSGTVALEAMCRGRAVVGVDTPTTSTVIADGTTGILTRPADPAGLVAAFRTLLNDPFRREALGQAGQDRVLATYSWSRVVGLLEAVYERALASAATPLTTAAQQAAAEASDAAEAASA
jgi:glycosyltransferase involved in cell wall biosynthesis